MNGTPREVAAGSTVSTLLQALDIRAEGVAVEHNKDIVKRDRFGETALSEGDQIEIIQFVGGG
ncbi:MAG: sulfur carrier protein ThiS [Leptospirillia bacterium]